jgi:hypothetical protein
VLGTQETFYIVIAGLLERDSFDLLLPEFNKPWVIQLRETCCCSTNPCTWGPNTVYKNRRVRRHHDASDFAIGAVLGQRRDKKLNVIHYASKTLDAAQKNYATTEKEFLAVVFCM